MPTLNELKKLLDIATKRADADCQVKVEDAPHRLAIRRADTGELLAYKKKDRTAVRPSELQTLHVNR